MFPESLLKEIGESQSVDSSFLKQEKILNYTKVICPSCGKVIPAKIIEREGYIYLQKKCIFENKEFESIIEKANRFWEEKEYDLEHRMRYKVKIGDDELKDELIENIEKTQSIFFLITQKCNANCPICYDKEWVRGREDMDIRFIQNKLKKFKNKDVYLSGGEPTVREDLPQIIRLIKESRNLPGIITNGLKLADEGYLRRLLDCGLEKVYISFDGFREDIYEILRGDAKQYWIKLKALENLKKANVRTIILATIVKGINDDQIPVLVKYCTDNRFVWRLSLRYLNIYGVNHSRNFGKEHLISREEMMLSVIQTLGIDFNYFNLFYDMKCAFVDFVSSFFPKIQIDQPYNAQIYLKREKRPIPLFTAAELLELIDAFRYRKVFNLLKFKYFRWIKIFLACRMKPALVEQKMYKMGYYSITAVRPPFLLSDYYFSGKVANIIYFPNTLPTFAAYIG
ncbi:radical SAM protein [bacterium]|nr:radical SAM protein [bacterium]